MLENVTFRTTSQHCWSNHEQLPPTSTTHKTRTLVLLPPVQKGAPMTQPVSRRQPEPHRGLASCAAGCRSVCMHDAFQHLHMAHQLHHPVSHFMTMSPGPSSLLSALVRSTVSFCGFLQISGKALFKLRRAAWVPLADSAAVSLSLQSSKLCSSLGHFWGQSSYTISFGCCKRG